jgi:hypothetical protein
MSSSLAELEHHLNRCIVTSRHRGFCRASQESELVRAIRKGELARARKKVGAGVDGTHLHSTFLLEQELQCKLNESRVVQLAVHKSEARVI